jgi:hypothetical protein
MTGDEMKKESWTDRGVVELRGERIGRSAAEAGLTNAGTVRGGKNA